MLCIRLWLDPAKSVLIYIWFSPDMLLLLVRNNFAGSDLSYILISNFVVSKRVMTPKCFSQQLTLGSSLEYAYFSLSP